jgi:hypothetical protein
MSVRYARAHQRLEQAAEESRHEVHVAGRADAWSDRPTVDGLLRRVVPGFFFVPRAGPAALLLLGGWLLLVLLIIPPAAALITLVLALAMGAVVLAAAATLIASPYLLAHYLITHEPIHRHWFAFLHRHARRATRYVPSIQAKGTT